MKYTLEFKLECVEKYKKGIRIDLPPGVKHRATFSHYLMDWVKAYEDLGEALATAVSSSNQVKSGKLNLYLTRGRERRGQNH